MLSVHHKCRVSTLREAAFHGWLPGVPLLPVNSEGNLSGCEEEMRCEKRNWLHFPCPFCASCGGWGPRIREILFYFVVDLLFFVGTHTG